MKWFLLLMGIFWATAGISLIIITDKTKAFLNKLIEGKDLKKLSIIQFIVGALLLLSAGSSKTALFISILGLLAIAKGLFFILGPAEKVKAMMDWWLNAPSDTCRTWGVFALALGIVVLCVSL